MVASFFVTDISLADIEAQPRSWVITSRSGEFLFKMVPSVGHWDGDKQIIEREAFGTAYQIDAEGELIEQWRSEGWYTFEAFLSDNGRYLARMGPWASDWENQTDLAIAFYDKGKLVKRYEVRELIKDPETLSETSSHYFWRPEEQSIPTGFYYDGEFHLVMIDRTSYTFDPATGNVMEEEIDAGSKTFSEVLAEEERVSMEAAKQLYRESSFRNDYDQHFSITELDILGHSSGVHFRGPQWEARLLLKKELSEHCEVSVIFPVDIIEGVETSITAKEIESALGAALDHPRISERFEGEVFSDAAYGLRLRITGDRLHWKTEALQEHLLAVGLKAETPEALRPWAYFIIDAQEPRYTTLYLNVETGDLIFEDPSTNPRKVLHFDSKGKPVQAH